MDRDLLGPGLRGRAGRRPARRCGTSPAGWSTARGTCGRTGRPATRWPPSASHRFFYGISTIAAILLFRSYFNDPDDVDAGLAGLATAFAASGSASSSPPW